MNPAHRVFVLLGAYEDLTERESNALRRGDIQHAVAIENRKQRLANSMREARQKTVLSADDLDALNQRVRTLEERETANLEFLRGEMARVGSALGALKKAALQSRKVRRGYAAAQGSMSALADGVLGRA